MVGSSGTAPRKHQAPQVQPKHTKWSAGRSWEPFLQMDTQYYHIITVNASYAPPILISYLWFFSDFRFKSFYNFFPRKNLSLGLHHFLIANSALAPDTSTHREFCGCCCFFSKCFSIMFHPNNSDTLWKDPLGPKRILFYSFLISIWSVHSAVNANCKYVYPIVHNTLRLAVPDKSSGGQTGWGIQAGAGWRVNECCFYNIRSFIAVKGNGKEHLLLWHVPECMFFIFFNFLIFFK